MCSDAEAVINVDGVSKYFEMYAKPAHRLWQMLWRGKRCFYEPYWALRDISFTVGQGECVGIIGRNGAGKSTLLQIITGTLAPSAGSVRVQGRVAALLELGSGFNPEFTGRENVYLNASILGLTKEEIDQRYKDIVAFADIGDFIDQPVKSYSSGMVVRLAFAVVAHVDADVLIIDEALAVGDAYFTQKCMRFLRHFIAEHTVLFVSHDTAAVNSLCNKAILLENGHNKQMGSPKEVTETYLKDMFENIQGESVLPTEDEASARDITHHAPNLDWPLKDEDFHDMRADFTDTPRSNIQLFTFPEVDLTSCRGGATVTGATLYDDKGNPFTWGKGGEAVTLRITVHAHEDLACPVVGFLLKNRLGQTLFGDNTFLSCCDHPLHICQGQDAQTLFAFTMPILEAGDYSISAGIADGTPQHYTLHDWQHDLLIIKSNSTTGIGHTGMVGFPMQSINLDAA